MLDMLFSPTSPPIRMSPMHHNIITHNVILTLFNIFLPGTKTVKNKRESTKVMTIKNIDKIVMIFLPLFFFIGFINDVFIASDIGSV